jgi:hypothetical protein
MVVVFHRKVRQGIIWRKLPFWISKPSQIKELGQKVAKTSSRNQRISFGKFCTQNNRTCYQ